MQFSLIPTRSASYITRSDAKIPLSKTSHIFFRNFFSSTVIEWNNLDPNLQNSDTYGIFKNTIVSKTSKQCV